MQGSAVRQRLSGKSLVIAERSRLRARARARARYHVPVVKLIPMTILGGSDRVAGRAEGPTAGLHPLAAYKGAQLRVAGKPIARVLGERALASGGFGPIRIAGPLRVYAELSPELEVVDTDASVGHNLRAAIAQHRATTPGPMAVIACDVLPSVAELRELREQYEQARPCAVWLPMVVKPERDEALGAFAWKPSYRIAATVGAEPLNILPGHLGIIDPEALRWPLLDRLFDSAYRSRNRPLLIKWASMLRAILWGLLLTDMKLACSLRAPSRTLSTVMAGVSIVRHLRRGELALSILEGAIERMLLRRSHRRKLGAGGVCLPLIETLSLAQDIDTLEEAQDVDRMELRDVSE